MDAIRYTLRKDDSWPRICWLLSPLNIWLSKLWIRRKSSKEESRRKENSVISSEGCHILRTHCLRIKGCSEGATQHSIREQQNLAQAQTCYKITEQYLELGRWLSW